MRLLFTLPILLTLAACNNEPGVVIAEPDDMDGEFLTVMERFETAYVGQWEENGNCSLAENVLDLSDDRVMFGDTTCAIDGLSKGTARVRLKLRECRIGNASAADRTYILDIAGSDILYVEGTTLPRTRLERCSS